MVDKRVTIPDILTLKEQGEPITMLTAYTAPFAALVDETGIDAILVGDSLGMVIQGHANSLPVTMDQMIYHTEIVVRNSRRALMIADMPFLSFQPGPRDAILNAGRLIKEGGAAAVKVEGGTSMAHIVKAIADSDIPVMGHIGLMPQSVHRMGGFKVQRESERLLEDAMAIEAAGAFAVVLECIPSDITAKIHERLSIPVIGIGAGADCDGQILVLQDILGLYNGRSPKFVKRYAEIGRLTREAIANYRQEVKEGKFPTREQSF